jgi:hypothetical protein
MSDATWRRLHDNAPRPSEPPDSFRRDHVHRVLPAFGNPARVGATPSAAMAFRRPAFQAGGAGPPTAEIHGGLDRRAAPAGVSGTLPRARRPRAERMLQTCSAGHTGVREILVSLHPPGLRCAAAPATPRLCGCTLLLRAFQCGLSKRAGKAQNRIEGHRHQTVQSTPWTRGDTH